MKPEQYSMLDRQDNKKSLQGDCHGRYPFALPECLQHSLGEVSERLSCTPETLLLACYVLLLHRHSGQQAIHIRVVAIPGSTVADNLPPEQPVAIKELLMSPTYKQTFSDLLQRIAEQLQPDEAGNLAVTALAVRTLPASRQSVSACFSLLGDDHLQVPDTRLAMQALQASLSSASTSSLAGLAQAAGLWLSVHSSGNGYQATFDYQPARYSEAGIVRMSEHFCNLLEQVGLQHAASRPLHAIPLMQKAEYFRIIDQYNHSEYCGSHNTVLAAWNHALRHASGQLAASEAELNLSYAELESRANQLAHYLLMQGVEQRNVVGVSLHRGINALVTVLAIMKTGAAYLPLNPHASPERTQFMLANARVETVVCSTLTRPVLCNPAINVIDINLLGNALTHYPQTPVNAYINDHNLASVIYTATQSSLPKAVAMPHGTLANLLYWQNQSSSATTGYRSLQQAELYSDVAFQEIFSSLSCGGHLLFISDQDKCYPANLLAALQSQQIQRLFIAPRQLNLLADYGNSQGLYPNSLLEVICSGEPLVINDNLREWFSHLPMTRLCHQYSTSETGAATQFVLTGHPAHWPTYPPIGKPIFNSEVFILDQNHEVVPIGVIGELYIGKTIARGYYSQNAETVKAFVANPFSRHPALLFKTGDKACFLDNGDVQCFGAAHREAATGLFELSLQAQDGLPS